MTTIYDLTPTEAAMMPRPAYVIVSLWGPTRSTGQRKPDERYVHTVRCEDYDPEWQRPLTWVQSMLDSSDAARRLRDLADQPGVDWYVEVASDGYSVFSGPGWQAQGDLEHAIAREARELVNP